MVGFYPFLNSDISFLARKNSGSSTDDSITYGVVHGGRKKKRNINYAAAAAAIHATYGRTETFSNIKATHSYAQCTR